MSPPQLNILMYHSISDGVGPTCISPRVFREQLAVLAEGGFRGIALRDIVPWLRGEAPLPTRSVAFTFDDGFDDFAQVVFPELKKRGWAATVFLPAGKIGGTNDWEAPDDPASARPLMSWKTIAELAGSRIEFGGHGITHADLTSMSPEAAEVEIAESKRIVEERAGRPVMSFAPPYGKSNAAVRRLIGRNYQVSVGTSLAAARQGSDRYNLPRIEMWYFRNPARWRALLAGKGKSHLLLRKVLRRLRQVITLG